jgi:hypothetical protein
MQSKSGLVETGYHNEKRNRIIIYLHLLLASKYRLKYSKESKIPKVLPRTSGYFLNYSSVISWLGTCIQFNEEYSFFIFASSLILLTELNIFCLLNSTYTTRKFDHLFPIKICNNDTLALNIFEMSNFTLMIISSTG